MHQTSEHPEFMKTIKEIRDAEEEYDRLINSAKEKADKIMREARERTIAERMKSEEELVAFKNEHLRNGSKEIEAEVGEIAEKAKDEGAKISKRKLESAAVSKLVKDFLGSL
jgi:vacuolar-type H+-ATPase subunit H